MLSIQTEVSEGSTLLENVHHTPAEAGVRPTHTDWSTNAAWFETAGKGLQPFIWQLNSSKPREFSLLQLSLSLNILTVISIIPPVANGELISPAAGWTGDEGRDGDGEYCTAELIRTSFTAI